MIKNLKIFVLTFVFLLSMNLVLGVDVQSQTIPLNVTVGEPSTISIEITNTANYKLWDVGFSSQNSIMQPINIEPNETVIANIIYTAIVPGSYSEILEMVSYKKISCIDAISDSDIDVIINVSGINPSDMTVCPGSVVRFENAYSDFIQLKIYPSQTFGDQILSGDSYSHTFDNVGNYDVEVLPLLLGSVVHVAVDDVLVHSSVDDIEIVLDVFAVYNPTNISIGSVGQSSFSMAYDGSVESWFIVNNIGDEDAVGISFSDSLDWFSFESNGFDLDSGGSKSVNFVVTPMISNSSMTNMTHEIVVSVGSLNSDPVSFNFSVFVPFSIISDSGNLSGDDWWREKKIFCDAYPSSPLCLSEPSVIYRDSGSSCPSILLNMSSEKLYDYLIESLKGQSTSEKGLNMIKADLDARNSYRAGMVNLTNTTNNELAEFSNRVDDLEGSFSAIIIGMLIVGIVLVLGFIGWQFYLSHKREGKNL